MRSPRRTFFAVAALAPLTLSTVLMPGDALAQDQAELALEEITVTARRREESLQDVPVAITAISGEQLTNIGATDLTEIQAFSPNLVIYPGRNQSTTITAFVRGIGQADPLWGVDPGVGIYLDDVYMARPQGALLDVFDVERVEVLRGPQGTLYGKNTIGGAIKYVSKPLTDEINGAVSYTFGEYETNELRASVGGALIDGVLRARAAAAIIENDGFGENLFTGDPVANKDTTAYRLAVEWLATDDLSVKLTYDKTDDSAAPKGYKRLEANPNCAVFLITCDPLGNPFDVEAGLEPTNGTESNGGSLTATWDISDAWTAKLISAYRESDSNNNIDFDTTPAPITDVFAIYYDEQYTHEVQVLYDAGDRLAGVAGIYYLDGEAGGLVRNIFFGAIFGTTNGITETESISAYTDWSYSLTDKLRLNAGVRVIAEEKRGIALNQGFSDATFTTVTATTADYDQTEDFDSVAPKFGLDYRLNDDVLLYGHVSQGFKSGGFNVRAQSTAFPDSALPFDDEELTNFEFGMKGAFLDGQATLNTALFWGDYTDIQVSTFTDFDSDGDGTDDAFFGSFLNAGEATISGIEVEWSLAPTNLDWLRLSGNLNYLDTDADEVDLNDNGLADVQVITNAPQKTAAVFADMFAPIGNGVLTARLGFSYRDATLMTNEGEGTIPLEQGAYQLWNASLAYTVDQWDFAVHAKNIGDKEYLTNGYNIPVLGIKTGSLGNPRMVIASVGYSF
ncbi:MAG: TonB-dependent receptor [Pseudomonadota bacterium]